MSIDRALPLVLALGLAGCASPSTPPPPAHGEGMLVLGVETMTQTRQRVQLEVDDDDANTPPVTARADLPAYSTSRDFTGLLFFILREKDLAGVSTGECGCSAHAAPDSEALLLPEGYRVTSITIEKREGDAWVTSGPKDLVVLP